MYPAYVELLEDGLQDDLLENLVKDLNICGM
jgi:hypothetical protein